MKQLLLILAFLGTSFFSLSQDNNDIPDVVSDAFSRKFSDVDNLTWDKRGNNYYVTFDKDKINYKAIFDAQGKLNRYKMEIEKSEIPAAILSKMSQNNRDHKIESVEKVVKEDEVLYQMELEGKNYYAKMVYTPDGKASSTGYWE